MKMMKTVISSVFVAGVLMSAAASANVLSGVTASTNVRVNVEDGVATLYGTVDSQFERTQAGVAAKNLEGVDEVRNLIVFTN